MSPPSLGVGNLLKVFGPTTGHTVFVPAPHLHGRELESNLKILLNARGDADGQSWI